MRRTTTMALVIGSALACFSWPAWAATPGAVCRRECKPRVLEQCGELTGGARRRCRRPLVRACKATSPAIACETTAELTQELADRIVRAADTRLTLCRDGSFRARRSTGNPNQMQLVSETSGGWSIAIANGALEITFDDGQTDPVSVSHDATGTLVLDGRSTATDDATTECNPPPPDDPTPPAPPPVDTDRLVSLAAALADRGLIIGEFGGDPTQRLALALCSSGGARKATIDDGASPSITTVRGTWTLSADGDSLVFTDENGTESRFGLEVRDDHTILLDGQVVEEEDVRAQCRDADLADALTSALRGKAFFFFQQIANLNLPLRTHLGLCDSGRYRMVTTSTQVGSWRVSVQNGVGTLNLRSDNGQAQSHFSVAFDASGNVTVENTTPDDDPDLVAAACQS
jgi:hypothetical protein